MEGAESQKLYVSLALAVLLFTVPAMRKNRFALTRDEGFDSKNGAASFDFERSYDRSLSVSPAEGWGF